jgi:hypothetical protein
MEKLSQNQAVDSVVRYNRYYEAACEALRRYYYHLEPARVIDGVRYLPLHGVLRTDDEVFHEVWGWNIARHINELFRERSSMVA